MAVKWGYFRFLHGCAGPDAEALYAWHIEKRSGTRMAAGLATDRWKRALDHYMFAAKALYAAMSRYGFNDRWPIPLDPNGELLGGSHRLACALALEIKDVPVTRLDNFVWAPPWGEEWFIAHGMGALDLARLSEDWHKLKKG